MLASLVKNFWLEVLVLHVDNLTHNEGRVGRKLVLVKVVGHTPTTTEPSIGTR